MAFDMSSAMRARQEREASSASPSPELSEVAPEDVAPELAGVMALVADVDRLMLSAGLRRFGVPRTFSVHAHVTRLFRYARDRHAYVLECGGDALGRVLLRVVRLPLDGLEEHRAIAFVDRPGHVLVAGLLVSKYFQPGPGSPQREPQVDSPALAAALNAHILSKFDLAADAGAVVVSPDKAARQAAGWEEAALGAAVFAGAAFLAVGVLVATRAAKRR